MPKNDSTTSPGDDAADSPPSREEEALKTKSLPFSKSADDPFELKKHVSGIAIIVVVCSLFWAMTKFGPEAGEWFTDRTKAAFGLNADQSDESEADPAPDAENQTEPGKETGQPQLAGKEENAAPLPVPAASPGSNSGSVVNSPPAPANSEAKRNGDPRVANAKQAILDALGGPEKVVVQHLAFSTDEKSMVAAVKLLNGQEAPELKEIFFEQDQFGRYVSTPDSPVGTVIKIWKEE